MTIEQAREHLYRRIIGQHYRHKDIGHVDEISEDRRIIHAAKGEEQAAELARYRHSETGAQLAQRVRLFNPATRAIVTPTYSMLNHIGRADGVKAEVVTTDETTKQLVERIANRFMGEKTLLDYLIDAICYANKYDPNMWIGYDRTPADASGNISIYPVEFSSDQLIDFGLSPNGRTEYYCAAITYTEKNANNVDVKVTSYWLYGPGYVLRAVTNDDNPIHTQIDPEQFTALELLEQGKPKPYLILEVENGTRECPFFSAGAFRYKRTQVCELLVQESVPLLKDIIRDSNLLAVVKVLHGFPERAEYVRACEGENEQGQPCENGYYYQGDGRRACGHCHGTGKQYVTSEQEVTTIKLEPHATPADLLELAKLKHYFPRDLDTTRFIVEEIQRQQQQVFATTFNQNSLTPVAVERTATEVNLIADQVNNKLSQVAYQIEVGWELFWRVGFQYHDKPDPDPMLDLGKDFKVIPLQQLLEDYARANAANLPGYVLRTMRADILNKQMPDSPDTRDEILAIEDWKPWTDKQAAEIAGIIAMRADDDYQRLLWENWGAVVRQLRANLGGRRFQRLTYQAQEQELARSCAEVAFGKQTADLQANVDRLLSGVRYAGAVSSD